MNQAHTILEKSRLHDFTDLHVKLGFYGGAKTHR